MTARIEAVTAPYDKDVQKSFDTIMPPGMPPLNIFKSVANNPRVLQRMVSGGLLDKGSISVQAREIIILRTCALCSAEYEWGVHVASFAKKAQLSQAQVDDTLSTKINSELWSDQQASLLAVADELHQTQTISDALWLSLSAHFDHEQCIELIMLAGLYHAVSFIVNGLKVSNETFAPSFKGTHLMPSL
jgi:alkylhydroperoxidase family enzyme